MQLQAARRCTTDEYLALERSHPERHQYLAGEMFAMGGASERHNLVVMNAAGELRTQLKGRPCRTYANDMRVKVAPTGLYTYPDIVVVCGGPRFDDEQRDTLVNPSVLIEVVSPSTEAYDRGEKFAHYRRLESLAEYVLIAQDAVHVEHYLRQSDNQWLLSETDRLDGMLRLPSIECELALAEIYDKVDLVGAAAAG
ncbi:MAG: Uma2 family endonuclease [Deltaproteobacteria bacterium]|nr:Uma2 family endonuclease [Deltaproteobacteria bacterium]